jgi:hypothetical protein
VPSFKELLELGTKRIQQQLAVRGVSAAPVLDVCLRRNKTNELLTLDLSAPATWEESEYAWFHVPGVPGGTDVSYDAITDFDLEYWSSNIDEHPPATVRQKEIRACLANGVYWTFRRSAGQPAIINFAYGMLAASLAELTDGLVFSDDSAWDYQRFPATSHEMYECYFRPEAAIDQGRADWARRCLDSIAAESGA